MSQILLNINAHGPGMGQANTGHILYKQVFSSLSHVLAENNPLIKCESYFLYI